MKLRIDWRRLNGWRPGRLNHPLPGFFVWRSPAQGVRIIRHRRRP